MSKSKEQITGSDSAYSADASPIIRKVMDFLLLFLPETLVKRVVSVILISAGVPNSRVTDLTGLCDRSVRQLKKTIDSGDTNGIFELHCGEKSGRKGKFLDIESAVLEEIERNNFNSYQQIADMIQEKFGIQSSIWAVRRFLKKTASNG
jgi:transposase